MSISNFTPIPREGYRVPLPRGGTWRVILNTDAERFGGGGVGPDGEVEAGGADNGVDLALPPLGTVWLEHAP